jgi:hypothetical protein
MGIIVCSVSIYVVSVPEPPHRSPYIILSNLIRFMFASPWIMDIVLVRIAVKIIATVGHDAWYDLGRSVTCGDE